MNGPRVEVTLPNGKPVRGTLIGPGYAYGPSDILIDGTWPSRPVDREDWEFLPGEELGGSRD